LAIPIIEAKNLTKHYGSIVAVHDLSFAIPPGVIYGFLGQNGAGKSTTMRMLLGLIHPSSGEVFILGKSLRKEGARLLRHIGAIIERPDLFGYLSGWDNLRMMANLSGQDISDQHLHDLLKLVHLQGREKEKVKGYSQGMKQRLGIAIAMAHNPDLLVLDEPTNGLDPQGIAQMRELILQLSREFGKTVLISSHLLYEIEQMADQMLIIHKGRKMVEGPVHELLHADETLVEVNYRPHPEMAALVAASQWVALVQEVHEDRLVLKMKPALVPELNRWLVEKDVAVQQLSTRHSLENYFLNLTQEQDSYVDAPATRRTLQNL